MKSRALRSTTTASLLVGAGLACAAVLSAASPENGPLRTQTCVDYQLVSGDVAIAGRAEFPRSEFEYQHGMKHRHDLAPDAAMIFDMDGRRGVAFWMKDTPSALDMAFFDPTGEMVFLTTAEPLSERLISAPGNPAIRHVMELPAGRASEIGLEVGATHLVVAAPTACADRNPSIP